MWVGWHSELPCCRESLVVIYERFLLTFTMPIVQVESSYSGNLFQIPMVAIWISKQLMHWRLCSVSNDLEICRHCSTNPSLISLIDRIQNICQDARVFNYCSGIFFSLAQSLYGAINRVSKNSQKTCSLQIIRLVVKAKMFILPKGMEMLNLHLLWTARIALSSHRKTKNLDQKVWNDFRKSSQISDGVPAPVAKGITSAALMQHSCVTIQRYIWKLQNQQASFACGSGFSNRSNLAKIPQE